MKILQGSHFNLKFNFFKIEKCLEQTTPYRIKIRYQHKGSNSRIKYCSYVKEATIEWVDSDV